jgi:F0F1-type ATP synthase assembly protein I
VPPVQLPASPSPTRRPTGRATAMLTAAPVGPALDRERKPATYPGEDRRRVERKYLRFAGVGIQFALTIVLLTLAGIWLDGRLGTSPLFTVVLLLLGFVGSTWSLVRTVLAPDKKKPDNRDKTA